MAFSLTSSCRHWLPRLFILLLGGVLAHEICRDTSGPLDIQLSFCSVHSGASCCTPEKDSEIRDIFYALAIPEGACANAMKALLCSQCDSWGAHIFGTEMGIDLDVTGTPVPYMCPSYCESFYSTCGSQTLAWPTNTNPFGVAKIDEIPKDLFCVKYSAPSNLPTCYKGEKFQPAPIQEGPPPSDAICVERFISGITSRDFMVALVDPKDGTDRLFAVHQSGSIKIHKRSIGEYIGEFLRLSVTHNGEAGLLNLAFHPNYAENRKFYVFYSCASCEVPCSTDSDCGTGISCTGGRCSGVITNVLSEFKADAGNPNAADRGSEKIVSGNRICPRKPYYNHNGGELLFGPDGMLYLTMGDGGGANDPLGSGQSLRTFLGKVLRIRVDPPFAEGKQYGIPDDNPFVGRADALPEIWAYGLRNPWRGSFDKVTGEFFLADVGQDSWEEINIITKGCNYGWPRSEGPTGVQDGINAPILHYHHREVGGGPSVIGGYRYRGTQAKCHIGKYIFADFSTRFIWSAALSTSGRWERTRITTKCASDSEGCVSPALIPAFAEDANGDMYILSTPDEVAEELQAVLRIVDPARCGLTCIQSSASAESAAISCNAARAITTFSTAAVTTRAATAAATAAAASTAAAVTAAAAAASTAAAVTAAAASITSTAAAVTATVAAASTAAAVTATAASITSTAAAAATDAAATTGAAATATSAAVTSLVTDSTAATLVTSTWASASTAGSQTSPASTVSTPTSTTSVETTSSITFSSTGAVTPGGAAPITSSSSVNSLAIRRLPTGWLALLSAVLLIAIL